MGNTPLNDEVSKVITKDNQLYSGKSAAYLASLRYTMRKALKRECRYPGCYDVVPGYLCDKHKAKVYDNHKAWYKRRKSK